MISNWVLKNCGDKKRSMKTRSLGHNHRLPGWWNLGKKLELLTFKRQRERRCGGETRTSNKMQCWRKNWEPVRTDAMRRCGPSSSSLAVFFFFERERWGGRKRQSTEGKGGLNDVESTIYLGQFSLLYIMLNRAAWWVSDSLIFIAI